MVILMIIVIILFIGFWLGIIIGNDLRCDHRWEELCKSSDKQGIQITYICNKCKKTKTITINSKKKCTIQ